MKKGTVFFIIMVIILCLNNFSILSAQNPVKGLTITTRLFGTDKDAEEFYKDSIPVILPEYFLLGTLSVNEEGRFDGLKENEVDRYRRNEESQVNYLKDYIRQRFKINVSVQKGRNGIIVYSDTLSKILNDYFDKGGRLSEKLFDSDQKIYSFLTGVYYRRGNRVAEKVYSFPEQFNGDLMYYLVNRAGCNKILYKGFKSDVALFYLKPSLFLKKSFDTVEQEKQALGNVYRKTKKDESVECLFDSFSE